MNLGRGSPQTVAVWVGRLLRFDFSVLSEIRAQPTATSAAVLIVLVASVLAGFGSWLWALQNTDLRGISAAEVFFKSLLAGSIIQTLVWFLWVYVVYQVLVHAYQARVNFSELVRGMGFAFAPVGLSLFIAIAGFAIPFGVISLGMALLITHVTIQQGANVEVREAAMANMTGFAVFCIVMGVFANISEVDTFGGLAPGIFFFSLDL